jgi:hypothetical protein
MNRTRVSFYYLMTYLATGGLGLLFAPRQFLALMQSNGDYGDVMPRLVGGLVFALFLIVLQIYRNKVEVLYATTLIVRIYLMGLLVGLWAYAHDPFLLVLLAIVTVGVILTATTYALDRRRVDPAK